MSSACERVLMIVEDDRDLRESIIEVLADREYQAIAAGNGKEALEQLRASPVKPCLILLDIMMPVMDGWQFRAEQEVDPDLRGIPVLVLTAHGNPRRAAAEMGVAGFLSKPVQLPMLFAAIEQFCASDDDEPA
jgi:CheY-like chemotaxis protein